MTTEEVGEGAGKGMELALPGNTIMKRHIATRASNRRKIVVIVEGDVEFNGYSIGLDEHSLQILELPSGEVSSISLDHIMSITDGQTFAELKPEDKNTVDRRTASFRKTAQNWLVKNWPEVYDRRDEDGGHHRPHQEDRPLYRPQRINARLVKTEYQARQEFLSRQEKEASGSGDQEVRD